MRYDCTFRSRNLPGTAWKGYNELRKAVRSKDIGLVKYLIGNGALVNAEYSNDNEPTPLHLAVISRCPEIVEFLLDNGANVNDSNIEGDTPLTLAARIGDSAVVDLLLSRDVQYYENSCTGLSHLHIACKQNNLRVVRKLILMDHGKSVNDAVKVDSIFWPGFTPLHFAVYYNCTEIVKYLLKCGVNTLAKDSKNLTPLHWADLRRNEEVIDLLLAVHNYEFENPVGFHGLSHFHIACTRDDASIVEHFLKLDIDIDLRAPRLGSNGEYPWTPIHFAMYYECPKVIELLLSLNADWKMTRCPNLLEYAFKLGNDTIYDLFIRDTNESCLELEIFSDHELACVHDNDEEMDFWLSSGIIDYSDLNRPLEGGYTLLHIAAKCNSIEVTKKLLDHEADFTLTDSQSRSPLHEAFKRSHLDIVDSILDAFSHDTPNITDSEGLSFFHILCSTDRVNLIVDFLSKGIDINARVSEESAYWAGFTPMQFACQFKQKSVVKLLLKNNADIFIENASISDHFNLVFKDFYYDIALYDFQIVLFENLMTALSSSSTKMKYSNDCKISSLHALCVNCDGDFELLKQNLITHKDEIDQQIEMPHSRNFHKCTPMHLAMRLNHFDRAKLLVDAKANFVILNGAGDTPIESAYLLGGTLNICEDEIESLFPCGTPIESLNPSQFYIACCSYAFEFVNYVLDNIDPELKINFLNYRNDLNRSPLHSLASHDGWEDGNSVPRREMMILLLKNGADVNAKDYLLQSPLYSALHANQEEIIPLLVDYGANVNIQNIYGETPLLSVICTNSGQRGHDISRMISTLLDNGADINIENKQCRSCLMMLRNHSVNGLSVRESAVPLLKHVKKLQVMGVSIDEAKNEAAYNSLLRMCENIFDELLFENKCERELELMRDTNIDRYTTVYDILSKSPNEMTYHCENSQLRDMFESKTADFPIYRSLVRAQMRKGRIRQLLLKSSKQTLTFLFGRSLPSTCLEMILHHLSDQELSNIILSGKRMNRD